MERVVTRSEAAHHVILSYNGRVLYVSKVRVHFCKGKEKHEAVFCTREDKNSPPKDLTLEIPQKLYEVLLKYTELDNPDLILVLHVEGSEFKWGFTSESWLRQYSSSEKLRKYVV